MHAFKQSLGILGTCIKEAPEFASRRTAQSRSDADLRTFAMSEFTIRSESVDVEQIMKQIRQRILEKRGADYTEDQIRELASVRLEKFLDPNNLRSDLLEQFRKSRPAADHRTAGDYAAVYVASRRLLATHRGALRFLRKLFSPLLNCCSTRTRCARCCTRRRSSTSTS